MSTLLLVIFIISVVLLIPTILMQSGSGAEAGMFGSDLTLGAFGAKTSEVLVKFTRWLVIIFLASAFLFTLIKMRENSLAPVTPKVNNSQAAPQSAAPADADTAAPQDSPAPLENTPLEIPIQQ